jgi:predicted aspartyl protease
MRGSLFALATVIAFTTLSARNANAQQSFAVVPTARSNQLHLFAPVAINGSQIKWFLVDTGAPVSLVSPDVRHALSLPSAGSGATVALVSGGAGKKSPVVYAQSVKSMDMELGPGYFVEAPIAFQAENTNEARVTFEKEGILGMNLLVKHGAVINCFTQQIFFSRDAAKLPLSPEHYKSMGFTYVPIRITNRGYVEVVGTALGSTYSFLIDTGEFWTMLTPQIQERAHVAGYRPGVIVNGPYSGVRNVPLTVARIPEFKLGDFDLSDLELGFCQLRCTDFGFTHEWGGIIGPELLFKRHAIIDLGNRALYLKSDKTK